MKKVERRGRTKPVDFVDELRYRLDNDEDIEREDTLINTLVDDIQSYYSSVTGFSCSAGKYAYRADLDSVLLEFNQRYDYGFPSLCTYQRPSRAKSTDPAMISLHPSDAEFTEFINRMIAVLIKHIQCSFNDSQYVVTEINNPNNKISDTSDESVIDNMIIPGARIANATKAKQFIYDLLDSGEVVNNLDPSAKPYY